MTAFDDETDIDVLTYSLSGAIGHVDSFNIDPVTGQITVSASESADADAADDTGSLGAADTPYEVTVIATDGDGDIQTIEVTIRVVGVDEPPRITDGPREMSHWEWDRTVRTATRIDTDLDSGVLDYTADPPTLVVANYQDATYTATDPEDDDATLTWSLAGPDGGLFTITGNNDDTIPTNDGAMATLAFGEGPDHETPLDTNQDKIYEVTLVVTDSVGATAEYAVTVKVINSTDDNLPGEVTILNRVPEVATILTATFEDPDGGVREPEWQWYRSVATDTAYPTVCPTSTDGNRYFIDTAPGLDPAFWVEIPNATSASYTPGYDEDSGGTSVVEDVEATRTVTWTGGDIDVTIVTTKATDDAPESTAYTWTNPRCLRATVTYRDAVDRTHAEPDDLGTAVDETLEGAFIGSEYPVKRIDEENDAPVFTEDGTDTGPVVSSYTAERREDTTGVTTPSVDITEAFAAADVMTDEDDASDNPVNGPTSDDPDVRNSPGPGPGADILTYSLRGTDARYFVIVGSVEHPTSYDPDGAGPARAIEDAGSLIIIDSLNFENPNKKSYTVTITATDPSGDDDSVTVTVNITDFNEGPGWVTAPTMVVYLENGTADVGTYLAKDPEGAGISYSLVADADAGIAEADIADRALFEIDPLDGILSFRSSPNYERPGDGLDAVGDATAATDNMYQIAVSATVVDSPALDPPHATTREVTVVVTNGNEAPVFSETTDTLEISENPDDPEKEPPSADGYLYLLNRGVGKPAANLPAAPNLDVGVPVVAVDDDSTSTFAIGGYTVPPNDRDRIDGLTYTLSGAGAGTMFDIVRATGQILTIGKLDYEARNSYMVTVTATDPWDASDSIDVTINVTNVDEVPVTPNLVVSGPNSQTYEENGTVAVGEYMAVGTGADMVRWIPVEGADSDYFELEGSGSNVVLKFRNPPNYEMPRGMAMSEDNTNTYMVTVKIEHTPSGETAEQDVTITVTDAAELGTLDGDETATYPENGTSAVDTYAVDGPMADMAMWTLEGDDMDQFTLDTNTGGSVMLMFGESPNYEMPRGMAMSADNANTYMVTVKAMVGGEMEMQDVTISVTDVDDMGMVAITPQPQVLRPGTMLTAALSDDDGNVIDVTWRWSRSMTMDGISTNIVGATSMTYTPVEADDGYYLMATATYTDAYGSGKTARAMTGMVNAVPDQLGTVRLSSMTPVIGAMLTATLSDPDGGVTGATWQWSRSMTMGGTFMDIAGATSMSYTPVDADEDYYLRATVMYTDGHGSGKEQMATTTAAVSAGDPLVNRYDANGNGMMEKDEVIVAINDYLFGTGPNVPTKDEVIRLINLYLFG